MTVTSHITCMLNFFSSVFSVSPTIILLYHSSQNLSTLLHFLNMAPGHKISKAKQYPVATANSKQAPKSKQGLSMQLKNSLPLLSS